MSDSKTIRMLDSEKTAEFSLATRHALSVLRACAHPLGFKASARADGYPQVWARDSMITALGALVTADPVLTAAAEASLETLTRHQSPRGMIPVNVHTRTKKPETSHNGGVDASAWYVIGLAAYVQAHKPNNAFLRRHFLHAEAALSWLACQDQNADGLIEMQEAGDWEDLFAVRGTGLLINVLWYAALERGARLAGLLGKRGVAAAWQKDAAKVRALVNERLWTKHPGAFLPAEGEWDQARDTKARAGRARASFYLPYYTFWHYGSWCDGLANLLAILFGVASKNQSRIILDYLARSGMAKPYPTKAITPVIRLGDEDWREYYRKARLNVPHQYHNGGIWPFIGGLHVAALVKEKRQKEAQTLLQKLAEANQKGKEHKWEFNEWLHGKTGKPMGMAGQAWSAAMFLYAREAVQRGRPLFF